MEVIPVETSFQVVKNKSKTITSAGIPIETSITAHEAALMIQSIPIAIRYIARINARSLLKLLDPSASRKKPGLFLSSFSAISIPQNVDYQQSPSNVRPT